MKSYFIYVILIATVKLVNSKESKNVDHLDSESDDWSTALEKYSQKVDLNGRVKRTFYTISMEATNYTTMVCSPITAVISLAKLIFGAEGRSQRELLKAVGLENEREVAVFVEQLTEDLTDIENVTLELSTRIYISHIKSINSDFKRRNYNIFHSSVELVDMSDPNLVAATVNWWVDANTHGKIKTLITPAAIDKDTVLLLVSGVYFHGEFNAYFRPIGDQLFSGLRGERTVPAMFAVDSFRVGYSSPLNGTIIEIPYKDPDISFFAFIPNVPTDLPNKISLLKKEPDLISRVHLKPAMINLMMPRFTVQTELDMESLYTEVGVNEIFTEKSRLTKIARNESVQLSKAVQMVMFEVTDGGAPPPPRPEVVDRRHDSPERTLYLNVPFLYMVLAKKLQIVAGIYS